MPETAPAAFDAYGSSYQDVVQDSISFSGLKHDVFLQAKVDVLAELFASRFGSKAPALLDVGCGVGLLHGRLRPLVRSLAGTDLSAASIERAAADNPGVAYKVQDGTALPWPDAAFDVTLAVCVLHHVPPPERDALMAEMRRVTRTGGLTVVIEHNPLNPLTRLAVSRCPFDHDAVLLGAREAGRLLQRQGYAAVASRHFLLLPWRTALARSAETALRSAPFGAQYAAWGEAA